MITGISDKTIAALLNESDETLSPIKVLEVTTIAASVSMFLSITCTGYMEESLR